MPSTFAHTLAILLLLASTSACSDRSNPKMAALQPQAPAPPQPPAPSPAAISAIHDVRDQLIAWTHHIVSSDERITRIAKLCPEVLRELATFTYEFPAPTIDPQTGQPRDHPFVFNIPGDTTMLNMLEMGGNKLDELLPRTFARFTPADQLKVLQAIDSFFLGVARSAHSQQSELTTLAALGLQCRFIEQMNQLPQDIRPTNIDQRLAAIQAYLKAKPRPSSLPE